MQGNRDVVWRMGGSRESTSRRRAARGCQRPPVVELLPDAVLVHVLVAGVRVLVAVAQRARVVAQQQKGLAEARQDGAGSAVKAVVYAAVCQVLRVGGIEKLSHLRAPRLGMFGRRQLNG